MKNLIYLHGFASNDKAYKAGYLKSKFANYDDVIFHTPNFNKSSQDFKYKTISGMIGRLRQYILIKELDNPYLIASSLSGVVALNYFHRFANLEGLLLLAPMTRFLRLFSEAEEKLWQDDGKIEIETAFAKDAELNYQFVEDGLKYVDRVAPPTNTMIIHGINDEVVSIAESRSYAKEYAVDLLELNSNHSLADDNSLEVIWQQSKLLLALS